MDKDETLHPGDFDRTIIIPRPGGRSTAPPSPPVPPRAPAPPPMGPIAPSYQATPLARTGSNLLLSAASALLVLIGELRGVVQYPDVGALRNQVVEAIRTFETTARSAGVHADTTLTARYALCTAIDETVLNTPWGGEGAWSQQSLLSAFHNETWGGEKFFLIIDRLNQDPAANLDLLELMYLLLSLGFQGKYRVAQGGAARLEELRGQLYQRTQHLRGEFARELSPHWRPTTATANRRTYWPWIVGAVALVAVLVSYLLFNARLQDHAESVEAILQGLEQAEPQPTAIPVTP